MTKIENFTKALIQKKTQKPQDSYILNFPNQKKKKKSQTPEKKNQTRKIKSRKPKRKKKYIYRKKK